MSRNFPDWLDAFVEYAGYGEAPARMYHWVGISTLAGALRRKVWIDQVYFKWHCNMYVVLVAPPGIVSKSTTAGIGMDLLRQVGGIRFGPDVVTWQSLVQSFAEAGEAFEWGGEFCTMSPITIESSEFGNLLNPADKEMVDMLVALWDGKQGNFEKRTKNSGTDIIQNPWINMIACTTPAWIAGNFPEYMIGGGFTSRCVFVYADKKEHYVAYPHLNVPVNLEEMRAKLIQDLEHISMMLAGPYTLTPDAVEWGTEWYRQHYEVANPALDDERFGGYRARKQTHIHKLAMVLSAAQRDDMLITSSDLIRANSLVTRLEDDMPFVFSKIGQESDALHVGRMLSYLEKTGGASYQEAYRQVHTNFPQAKDFEEVLNGAVRAGLVRLEQRNGGIWLAPAED
jgi:hypothetical protein